MAHFRGVLLAALLFTALPALADSVPAGFPPGSLWLSATNATSGNTLTIYTVVYNSSASLVSGDVVFSMDGATLGTKHFDADPGTTQIVSEAWTAVAGTHSFSAQIQNSSSGGLSNTTTGSVSVRVAAPPPPPAVVTNTIETASAAQSIAASTTPILQNIASTTLATTEGIRAAGLTELQNLAAAASSSAASSTISGKVLGISDYQPQGTDTSVTASAGLSSIGTLLNGAWRGALGFLIVIFSSKLWFYILLFVVLFVVYKFFRVAFSDRKKNRNRD